MQFLPCSLCALLELLPSPPRAPHVYRSMRFPSPGPISSTWHVHWPLHAPSFLPCSLCAPAPPCSTCASLHAGSKSRPNFLDLACPLAIACTFPPCSLCALIEFIVMLRACLAIKHIISYRLHFLQPTIGNCQAPVPRAPHHIPCQFHASFHMFHPCLLLTFVVSFLVCDCLCDRTTRSGGAGMRTWKRG